MRAIYLGLTALLSSTVLAESTTQNTPIYNVKVEASWQHAAGATTGQVQVAIKNNTLIPLTFSSVKLRHYCQQQAAGKPNYIDRDYPSAYRQRFIKPGATATQPAKRFSEAAKGPCSEHGGVVRSKVIDVDFYQDKMMPADHRMLCGNKVVPVVWVLDADVDSYSLYTDSNTLSYTFADGSANITQLTNDVCDFEQADEASLERWQMLFVDNINQWAKACVKYPEKCSQAYAKLNKGWTAGAIQPVQSKTNGAASLVKKQSVPAQVSNSRWTVTPGVSTDSITPAQTSPAVTMQVTPGAVRSATLENGCPAAPAPYKRSTPVTLQTHVAGVSMARLICLYGNNEEYKVERAYPIGNAQAACSDPGLNPKLAMAQLARQMGGNGVNLPSFGVPQPITLIPVQEVEIFGFSFQEVEGLRKVRVERVFSGSPAEKAGLMVGDIILTINGDSNSAKSEPSVLNALSRSGKNAMLTVQRQNQMLFLRLAKFKFFPPQPIMMQSQTTLGVVVMELPYNGGDQAQYQEWVDIGQRFLKAGENLAIACTP